MRIPGAEPQDEEFDSLLNEGLRGIRPKLEKCPPAEMLAAYYQQELPEAEAAEISRHVKQCGLCEACLALLERADEPLGDKELAGVDDSEMKVAAGVEAFLQSQTCHIPKSKPLSRAWYGFLWHPAPAYGLVAVLGITLWVGEKPDEVRKVASVEATSSLPGFVLDMTRSEGSAPPAGFESSQFFISVQIPIRDGHTYHAAVEAVGGGQVLDLGEVRSFDRVGSFLLVLQRNLFQSGQYQLTIAESPATPRTDPQRFTFDFTL